MDDNVSCKIIIVKSPITNISKFILLKNIHKADKKSKQSSLIRSGRTERIQTTFNFIPDNFSFTIVHSIKSGGTSDNSRIS